MDHDHGMPGVEDAVGDHCSDRRAADYIVPIDVAAEDAIVEVVGQAMIVDRADVARNMHVISKVVVIRVHVRDRLRRRRRSSSVRRTVVLRSRLRTSLTMIIVTSLGFHCSRAGSRCRASVIGLVYVGRRRRRITSGGRRS